MQTSTELADWTGPHSVAALLKVECDPTNATPVKDVLIAQLEE